MELPDFRAVHYLFDGDVGYKVQKRLRHLEHCSAEVRTLRATPPPFTYFGRRERERQVNRAGLPSRSSRRIPVSYPQGWPVGVARWKVIGQAARGARSHGASVPAHALQRLTHPRGIQRLIVGHPDRQLVHRRPFIYRSAIRRGGTFVGTRVRSAAFLCSCSARISSMCSHSLCIFSLGTLGSPPQRWQMLLPRIDGRVRAAVWGRASTDQGELLEAGGIATAITGVVAVVARPARHHVSCLSPQGVRLSVDPVRLPGVVGVLPFHRRLQITNPASLSTRARRDRPRPGGSSSATPPDGR